MYIMSFRLSVVPYKLDLDRLNEENGYFYQPYQAYHHSKLLNVLFTRELSKRLKGNIAAAFQGMHVSPANHSDTE